MKLNKEFFGRYRKIKFMFNKKTMDTDIEELTRIFTKNPSYGEVRDLYISYEDDNPKKFLKFLYEEKINIFEYQIDEAKEPKMPFEKERYHEVVNLGKAKIINLKQVCWNADCFFRSKGFEMICYKGTSTYLKIISKNGSNQDVLNKNIIIKCGQIDADRILQEAVYGVNWIWIFPFYYKSNPRCYLIDISEELIQNLKKEKFDQLQEPLKKLGNLFKDI